jgi:hypothetical protein
LKLQIVTAASGVLSSCVLPAVAAVDRETRTAKLVAEQLKRMGLAVQTVVLDYLESK